MIKISTGVLAALLALSVPQAGVASTDFGGSAAAPASISSVGVMKTPFGIVGGGPTAVWLCTLPGVELICR